MRPVCLPEKYEIIKTLGQGGMGAVWHARDRILQRDVALKVLSEKYATDPHFVQRFTTEARAVASLNHPNIVQIYEFGQTEGGHFLAMELIDGPSLKDELKHRGRFSEAETLAVARQACGALAVAHAAGIVHRDIKPDNIMFTRTRQFKLVDLGLAKRLDEEISQTMTGQSLGTPHFISPEQILGAGEIDGRTDIYSLGATMYYLATGSVPFDGSSGAHIMSRHLNDPLPDPRHKAPDLSSDFCRVLGRMMAKEPRDRYQNIAEVATDLQAVQQGGSIDHTEPVATAVQETIFMSSPDLTEAAPAVTWDDDDLLRLGKALAGHIGPLAGMLVRNARRKAHSREQLVDELASHIPDQKARDAFRKKCARLVRGEQTTKIDTPPDLDPGATMAMPQPINSKTRLDSTVGHHSGDVVFALEPDVRDRMVQALADHIGPVARIVLKRELRGVRSFTELTNRLLANLPDEATRRTFEAKVQGLA
ncbi:MAG: serine/threonine-protein kinase [Candidatus Krumholzibacteria bacterium]|nr:serine/threonine-protein kinase [Candidatus Krumholzibacteria bacterium]